MSIPPSNGLLHALGHVAQHKPAARPAAAVPTGRAPWLPPAAGAAAAAPAEAAGRGAPARHAQGVAPLDRVPEAPRPNMPRGSLLDVKV